MKPADGDEEKLLDITPQAHRFPGTPRCALRRCRPFEAATPLSGARMSWRAVPPGEPLDMPRPFFCQPGLTSFLWQLTHLPSSFFELQAGITANESVFYGFINV